MQMEKTSLPGVLVLTPARFGDARGFFSESWNKARLTAHGIAFDFVQDNHSLSAESGAVRGLHFQAPPTPKVSWYAAGRANCLMLPLISAKARRRTGGGPELSAEIGKQLLVLAGFLHGVITRAPGTEVIYKYTDYYAAECEGAVRWDSCGINWGFDGEPVLSDKDAAAHTFAAFDSPFIWKAAS
jgi:dTDP-4-dehydrorhamnose 3,5-epimerase